MDLTLDHIFGNKYRVLWHSLFWLAVLIFYTFFFGQQSQDYLRTLYFAGPLMVVTIGTTWFVSYFLFPRFLAKGRYFRLLMYSVFTFIVSVWVETIVIVLLLLGLIYSGRQMPDHTNLNLLFLVVGMYFVIVIAISVKLLKFWYEKQNQLQAVAHDKLEAELKLLRAQIHPHFLFNTLNNIYALALKKSDTAPEMILKLSDILDYLLYECDAARVPLSKELTLIHNYIALEKIRYADRLNLDFTVEGAMDGVEVAPLILLPFIENSFKHGAGKKREGVYVKIMLVVQNGILNFSVENNKLNEPEKQKQGGIGLENINRRLNLVYPDVHKLQVEDSGDTFTINLEVKLT